jgi:cytidylate kinase
MMAQANSGSSDMLTKENRIFVAEQEEIRKLAKQGNAVFLGHCACEALKEEDSVIKVFIRCSDNAAKQERIIRDYGISKEQVDVVKERYDKKRANYYHANTNGKWKDYGSYDIVLDSAKIGIEGCAGILSGMLLC